MDQSGILYAGTESGKLFRSLTDGNDWSRLPLPVEDGGVTAIVVDPLQRIFVANDVHGVFASIDGGSSWTGINSGLADTAIYALAYLPGGALIAGSAGGELSITEGGATVWTRKLTLARPVTSILVMSTEEIYAAAWSAGVYRFDDGGTRVEAVNTGLPDLYINSLYSGASGYLIAGSRTGGVFRSTFDTVFWQNTGAGTISREVNAFRTSQYGEIFAGTRTGVYRSTDLGLHWMKLDVGLGSQEVRALAISENATVFAGTVDGVYRSIRRDTGWSLLSPIQAGFRPR